MVLQSSLTSIYTFYTINGEFIGKTTEFYYFCNDLGMVNNLVKNVSTKFSEIFVQSKNNRK